VALPPSHAIACLKDAGRQSVWLIQRPRQEPRTLKSWPLSPLLVVKLSMGIAQPQRQLEAERRLVRAGIKTAPAVGGWRIAWRRWQPQVELELAYVAGRSALVLAGARSAGDSDRRRRGAAIGDVIAQLVGAGLFHRDLKLSNLIVDDSAGRCDVWLIDTVGVRSMRRPVPEITHMLERLAVQPPARGIHLSKAAWLPALLHALRPLEARTRRAVVRQLKEHRSRQSG
jgi:hypothetical protein